jgi:hypothetical protein
MYMAPWWWIFYVPKHVGVIFIILILSTLYIIVYNLDNKIFMGIRSQCVELFCADRRRYMTKVMFSFRHLAGST